MGAKLTIGKRFGWTGAFLIGISLVLGATAEIGFGSIDEALDQITQDGLAGLAACGKVEADLLEIGADTWHHVSSTDAADMAAVESEIERLKDRTRVDLRALEATVEPEEGPLFAKIEPAIGRYYQAWAGVVEVSRASRNEEAYRKYMAEVAPAFTEARRAVAEETEFNRKAGFANAAAANATGHSARWITWLVLAAGALAGAGLLVFSARGVNRALQTAVEELATSADQVGAAAAQVASSSQSLSQSASEQAASLEETSSSSEEISSMAHQNADNSRAAAEHMAQTARIVEAANSSLEHMVCSMNEINASSDKIARIIKVIDEIAFQTNILALNAAVEAARAGEAGMGFAVVADEVRSLAQRSAQAAKDTAGMIEESISKTGDGKAKLDQVAASIRSITASSATVSRLVDEIKAGSEEQARGLEQVSRAVAQMQQVTQTNAAGSEESAAASEQLRAQAQALRTVIAGLTEMVNGEDRRRAPAARREASRAAASKARAAVTNATESGYEIAGRTHGEEFPMD